MAGNLSERRKQLNPPGEPGFRDGPTDAQQRGDIDQRQAGSVEKDVDRSHDADLIRTLEACFTANCSRKEAALSGGRQIRQQLPGQIRDAVDSGSLRCCHDQGWSTNHPEFVSGFVEELGSPLTHPVDRFFDTQPLVVDAQVSIVTPSRGKAVVFGIDPIDMVPPFLRGRFGALDSPNVPNRFPAQR